LLTYLRTKHRAELDELKSGKLTAEITSVIKNVVEELSSKYVN